MVNLGLRFVFLLLITTIVVVPIILLRDVAIHWLLLDMKHQHNMAVTVISKPIYFNVVFWLLTFVVAGITHRIFLSRDRS